MAPVLLNILAFLFVFTLIVFVHELGHFLVAKWNGVKIEVFAIGFGPELFGFTDNHGTRWKFCAVPLGGYVKMYGDANIASTGPTHEQGVDEEVKKNWHLTVHSKSPLQRAAVAFAGPAANYLFAFIVFFGLYSVMGKPFTLPSIGFIQEGSVAETSGLLVGDKVLEANGKAISSFEDFELMIKTNPGKTLNLKLDRGGKEIDLAVTPQEKVIKDVLGGGEVKIGLLGIKSLEKGWTDVSIGGAFAEAGHQIWFFTSGTLQALGQMMTGGRSADELGGPIRIFQMSGQVAQMGFAALISFMALLSISLGLINLFPIPALDGGHILMCGIEAAIGKPINEKVQEYITMIGVGLLLCLMIFATWNDLSQLKFFEWIKGIFAKG